MKKPRKLLPLLLSAMLIISLVPATAFAETGGEHGSDPMQLVQQDCVCTQPCMEDSINADCPVCSGENAEQASCLGAPSEEPKPNSVPPLAPLEAEATGDFAVTDGNYGTDYSYENNTLTILSSEEVTISMVEGKDKTTADKIVIQDNVTANVTLNNVHIDVSDTEKACAFEVAGTATCNLTLSGTNTLKSGTDRAGLQVQKNAALTITKGSRGKLNATGGNNGAGIGGGLKGVAGNITIDGGTINASGSSYYTQVQIGWDIHRYYTGTVGIGSGWDGLGGTVTITGGTVTAYGKTDRAGIGMLSEINITGGEIKASGGSDTFTGCGIGNNSANVTISGGIVTANDDGIKGDFSTGENGHGVIYATSIQNESYIADEKTSGVIFIGAEGTVYGSPEISQSLNISKEQTLNVPEGTNLTMKDGVTLTNSGTLFNLGTVKGSFTNKGTVYATGPFEGGTIKNEASAVMYVGEEITGTLTNNGMIYLWGKGSVPQGTSGNIESIDSGEDGEMNAGDLNVSGIEEGTYVLYVKSTTENNPDILMVFNTAEPITISGTNSTETKTQIMVNSPNPINITLNNVKINVSETKDACAFHVQGNSTCNLTLSGENLLKSGENRAGIQAEKGSTLTIASESDGTLTVEGGTNGAGIGGGKDGTGGNITITGDASIIATGGTKGNGIGDGSNGTKTANILINDEAKVDANAGQTAPENAAIRGNLTVGGSAVVKAQGYQYYGQPNGQPAIAGSLSSEENSKAKITAFTWNPAVNTVNFTSGIIFHSGTNPYEASKDISTDNSGNVTLGKPMSCLVYGEQTLDGDMTINEGGTLTVQEGAVLTIPKGKKLVNNGTINKYGTIIGDVEYGESGTQNEASETTITFLDENGKVLKDNITSYGSKIKIVATMGEKTETNALTRAPSNSVDFRLGTERTWLSTVTVTDNQASFTLDSNTWKNQKWVITDTDSGETPGDAENVGNLITVEYGGNPGSHLLDSRKQVRLIVTKGIQTAVTPTLSRATASSITLQTLAPGPVGVEYGYTTAESQDANGEPNITWQDVTEFKNNLSPATAYNFYARYKGNDYYNQSAISAPVTIYTLPETPEIDDVTIDYEGETITFGDTLEANTSQDFASETAVISGVPFTDMIGNNAFDIYVRVKEKDGVPASAPLQIQLPGRRNAPEVTPVHEVWAGDGGQINGINTEMEYRLKENDEDNWTTYQENPATTFAPGTYLVRYKAVTTEGQEAFASKPAEVTIESGQVRTYTLTVEAPSFDTVNTGYEQPVAKPIKIISSGNQNTTVTGVALSGENADAFTLNKTEGKEISKETTDETYTIQPNAELGAGKYSADIVVTYNDGETPAQAKATVTFTVRRPGGGSITQPEPEKPTISTGDGYETEVDKDGNLEIKVDDDYEIEDVLVNGESKGPVISLSGLKTGDKVEVIVISKEDKHNAYLKEGVKDTTIKAWSERTKKGIKVYFKKSYGFKVDGYEFFRSTKKGTFSKKPYYVSQKRTAKYLNNTKNLKKGTRYYYKIRGYRTIAGEKVYTQWSNIASRPAK